MKKKCFLCGQRIEGWALSDLDTNLTFCSDCFNEKREEAEEEVLKAKEDEDEDDLPVIKNI